MMKAIRWAVVGTVLSMLGASALADVKLQAIFSDNMVLEKSEKTPFFGSADKGEKVTVKVGEAAGEATAGDDGTWKLFVDTRWVKGPVEVSVAGNNSIGIKNVLVGEVWVASGQSNMEFTVSSVRDADLEIAAADYPELRMFTVEKATALEPAKDVKGKWEVCTPQVTGHFSAVGYFFARDLNQQLKTPVGVIHTSWGGTAAEAWTSREALSAADPEVKTIIERFDTARAKVTPEAKQKYEEDLKAWKEAGSPRGKQPRKLPGEGDPNAPTALYNAMISPLVGYGIKGAIWYQGESNAGRSYQYRKLFPAMITDWRSRWGEGDFPFYWVQLANFMPRDKEPAESGWAELREAQTMTQSLPNTGQAVIIDIGEAFDIHPKNKEDVGRRLARLALKRDYGKNIADSGPVFDTMLVEGNTIRLKFKNAQGGLVAKQPLTGFAVAGEDHKFVWASEAKIEGETVVLKSPVAKPMAVRYAWGNNPEATLYNHANLPACPFRTDDWAGVTAGKN